MAEPGPAGVLAEILAKSRGSLPVSLPPGTISSEAIEWQPQGDAITDPTGGSTVDTEAREAIAAILAFLRSQRVIAS